MKHLRKALPLVVLVVIVTLLIVGIVVDSNRIPSITEILHPLTPTPRPSLASRYAEFADGLGIEVVDFDVEVEKENLWIAIAPKDKHDPHIKVHHFYALHLLTHY